MTQSRTYTCMFAFACALLSAFVLNGCTRGAYRKHADNEVYDLLARSSAGTPWEVAPNFSIEPPPESRLQDGSDPDFPALPEPGPNLYAYELPAAASTAVADVSSSTDADRGDLPSAATPPETGPTDASPRQKLEVAGLPIQPVPPAYWDSVPNKCLARMMELESVRDEYQRAYKEAPGEDLRDDSPRLSLDRIIELALLNSREYQAEKEALYQAALSLTLERFDYWPKFAAGGTGSDAEYFRDKTPGNSPVSGANIGSSVEFDKMLETGGSVLARFANDVVMTFDGPEGWSREISSNLLFNISQSIFQRDVRLNPLIQAERNLVYAARRFARFRKEFFLGLAASYYGLLRNYRNVEIESQNYFSLVRTFEQAQAELRAGVENSPNPVAVDQFEQGVLSGRSGLISSCNVLESALDGLKLQIGLPTETPININLLELEELTLRDEIEVAAERARRWLSRLLYRNSQTRFDRAEVLNANIYLVERLLEWIRLRQKLDQVTAFSTTELEKLLGENRIDQGRIRVSENVRELQRAQDDGARAPVILIYQRTDDLVDSMLKLVDELLAHGGRSDRDGEALEGLRQRRRQLREEFDSVRDRLPEVLRDPVREKLDGLLSDANGIRTRADELIQALDELLDSADEAALDEDAAIARTRTGTERIIAVTDEYLEASGGGLPVVEISLDDAMATALVQRLDLMTERGQLADDRRAVKIAADELLSVLNLDASYTLRSERDKPFKFSSNDSRFSARLMFDLPINRRAQRNDYRESLINFDRGRRSLMALEDSIKLDVREDVRTLEETRIQYPISVRSAALAAEQVLSIRLQLALGVADVRGRDLLDALQDSRQALISVANLRIGYIVDRARFVQNLELIELDNLGFWRSINDPSYQPEANLVYPENAGPTYGTLPPYLLVSNEIREMLEGPLPGEPAPAEAEVADAEELQADAD